jgi:DNA-binding NtrC family response regulator
VSDGMLRGATCTDSGGDGAAPDPGEDRTHVGVLDDGDAQWLGAAERILIAEDNEALRTTLTEILEGCGYRVRQCPNGEAALRAIQRHRVDLVITDLRMPGMGGEALLDQVRRAYPEVPVITMTAFGSVETAVALTRAGAAEYLTKPLQTQRLLEAVRRLLDESRAAREQRRTVTRYGPHLRGIVGRSRAMGHLFEQIARVAPTTAPVLISGETGAGKELVARAVHRASGRGEFVPINCGAIPESLLESELFGHVRGAFTGADRDRVGYFEAANGGTLFLDEIAEIPVHLQAKLLRVLQSGELRRVGEVEPRHVEVRLIAATHRDLAGLVLDGSFREDLFYRINVLRLEVPPLRDRTADIPLLVEQFLADIAARDGAPEKRLSPAALAALVTHPWPGNVRELRNVIERAAVFADGAEIEADGLPDEVVHGVPENHVHGRIGRELTLAELEREHILGVLDRMGGNRSRAADILGIPRRTLYRRLEEYGVVGEG